MSIRATGISSRQPSPVCLLRKSLRRNSILGKLYVEYEKIEKFRRQLKYIENAKAEKDKADRLSGVSD